MNKRWIFITILSLLFVGLTILIKTNMIVEFDNIIYNLVTIKRSGVITTIYKIITFLGSTTFITSLVIFFLIIFSISRKRIISCTIPVVLIISTIVNQLVKIIIRRSRPVAIALVTERTFSYPSGHTMAATTMYGFLIYLLFKSSVSKKIKMVGSILLIILTTLIMISRIYLGVHYASDVIGAALLSILLLLVEIDFIERKKLIR